MTALNPSASKAPLNSIQTIDLAATFTDRARTPYVTVFVTLGTAPFDLAGTEFTKMKELRGEIAQLTELKNVNRAQFEPTFGQNAMLVTFASKAVHTAFMDAVLGKNTDHPDRVVQVGGKSREWHHAAGTYIAYQNRARVAENPAAQPLTQSNVSRFGGTLVNYTFPDLATMRDFCVRVHEGKFDMLAKELRKASAGGNAPR